MHRKQSSKLRVLVRWMHYYARRKVLQLSGDVIEALVNISFCFSQILLHQNRPDQLKHVRIVIQKLQFLQYRFLTTSASPNVRGPTTISRTTVNQIWIPHHENKETTIPSAPFRSPHAEQYTAALLDDSYLYLWKNPIIDESDSGNVQDAKCAETLSP